MRRIYRQVVSVEDYRDHLEQLAETANALRNLAIVQCRKWIEMDKDDPNRKPLTDFSLNYWLTARREENLSLTESVKIRGLQTEVARQMLVTVAGSFRSFFNLKKNGDRRARLPETKPWPCPITLSWRTIRITADNTIKLSGLSGQKLILPIPQYLRDATRDKKIVYASMRRDLKGDWWLCLTVSSPAPELRPPREFIGVDVGAGDVAIATSSGQISLIPARRPDRWAMARIAEVERRQKDLSKDSRRYKCLAGARRTLFKLFSQQERDFQRKLANALVKTADVLVIGVTPIRLGLAQTNRGVAKQHWGVQNTGYLARLIQLIESKAAERGVEVLKKSDPRRDGPLNDPTAKFAAAIKLLETGMREYICSPPPGYQQVRFTFKQ